MNRHMKSPSTGQAAIVIVADRRASLCADCILSVMRHANPQRTVAVVVRTPTCPDSVASDLRQLSHSAPSKVTVLSCQSDRRSIARNSAIDHLLARYPGLTWVLFLDPDSTVIADPIRPLTALDGANEDIGLCYGPMEVVGVDERRGPPVAVNALAALVGNFMPPDFAVRADLFRSSLRFNEALGRDDDDRQLVLDASTAGWRALPLDSTCFVHRQRSSQFKALVDRDELQEVGFRATNRTARDPRSLVGIEHHFGPRYAILTSDESRVLLATDPCRPGHEISPEQLVQDFAALEANPSARAFPSFVVVTTSQTISALKRAGVLRWLLWRLECLLDEADIGLVRVGPARNPTIHTAQHQRVDESFGTEDIQLLACSSRWLLHSIQSNAAFSQTLLAQQGAHRSCAIEVKLTTDILPQALPSFAYFSFLDLCHKLRFSESRQGGAAQVKNEPVERSLGDLIRRGLRDYAGLGRAPLYPLSRLPGEKRAAFVLPHVTFGGLDKITIHVAETLRNAGWVCDLVVWNASTVDLPYEYLDHFDQIAFLSVPQPADWDARWSYFGTGMPEWSRETAIHDFGRAILANYDAVLPAHAPGINTVVEWLRRNGIVCVHHIEVIDHSEYGLPSGHPYLGQYFEPRYDAIHVPSPMLADWAVGMGIPRDKLIVVPNCEGFRVDREQARQITKQRQARSGKLRILYLGRFDRQKGFERIAAVIDQLQHHEDKFDFRLVGSSLVKKDAAAILPTGVRIEPPVYGSKALSEVYQWADVVLLLSYWEGLPLTAVEAMLHGCVMLISEVGAIRDLIDDGRTGIIVSQKHAVEESKAQLLDLAADRQRLLDISAAAFAAVEQRTWSRSCAELIGFLERETHRNGRQWEALLASICNPKPVARKEPEFQAVLS